MGEIIERYRVNGYDFAGCPDRAAWCHYHEEAHRLSELASDDMRTVLRLLNRRAEIIKAQRATIAELRDQLVIAQLDNRMLEVRLEAAHDNVAELEKTSAEQFDLCETLRGRIYALRTKNNELEAELATCQSDLRRAQLEAAELQAERAGCIEMCMGDDVLAVIPGLWGESAPDPHYGGD